MLRLVNDRIVSGIVKQERQIRLATHERGLKIIVLYDRVLVEDDDDQGRSEKSPVVQRSTRRGRGRGRRDAGQAWARAGVT